MEPAPRKRRWLIPAIIASVYLIGFVLLGEATKPPFEFIGKLKGKRVPIASVTSRQVGPAGWGNTNPSKPILAEAYAFRGKPDEVRAAVAEEMRSRGWLAITLPESVDAYVEAGVPLAQSPQSVDLYWDAADEHFTCYMVVQRVPGWLERQWTAVQKWFGVDRERP